MYTISVYVFALNCRFILTCKSKERVSTRRSTCLASTRMSGREVYLIYNTTARIVCLENKIFNARVIKSINMYI